MRCQTPSTPPTVAYLQARDLLQERTLFFHCDQVNRQEAEVFAEAGVAISHNPQSNATYHGCVADVPALREAGVTLGMGTDMPAGNIFDNIYTAYLVNSVVPLDQEAQFEPWVPIEMGSAAPRRCGSVTRSGRSTSSRWTCNGTRPSTPSTRGTSSTGSSPTLAADTMVDGTFLMRDGEFTFLDEEAIIARSDEWMIRFETWYRGRKASGQPVTVRLYPDYENR